MFPSTLRTSVPVYTGATSQTPGKAGLVPAANIGEQDYVFTGGGTYKQLTTLEVFNTFRKAFIGIPHPWSSTTLETGYTWADGGFVSFDDWPELKEKYEANGFDGMLLPWNADESTIAANLGKWRPNATNPTGLYTPSYNDQFSCIWIPGNTKQAGGTNKAGLPELSGDAGAIVLVGDSHTATGVFNSSILAPAPNGTNATWQSMGTGYLSNLIFKASKNNTIYGNASTVMPPSINIPHVIYLGLTFDDYTNAIQKKCITISYLWDFPQIASHIRICSI